LWCPFLGDQIKLDNAPILINDLLRLLLVDLLKHLVEFAHALGGKVLRFVLLG